MWLPTKLVVGPVSARSYPSSGCRGGREGGLRTAVWEGMCFFHVVSGQELLTVRLVPSGYSMRGSYPLCSLACRMVRYGFYQ